MNESEILVTMKEKRKDLGWLWSSALVIESHSQRVFLQNGDLKDLRYNAELATTLRDGFRWFCAVAHTCDMELSKSHRMAILLETGNALDEIRYEAIESLAEIDKWLLSLEYKVDEPETTDEQYEQAISLWNAGKLSWSKVAIACGEDETDWKSFSQAVKRYADKSGQELRKAKPGRKKE
jgi:hypothetical protein